MPVEAFYPQPQPNQLVIGLWLIQECHYQHRGLNLKTPTVALVQNICYFALDYLSGAIDSVISHNSVMLS